MSEVWGLSAVAWGVLIYAAGIAIGLAVMRDPWPLRVGTAVAWPLGPLAFAIVVPILLIAAVILWPVRMLGAAALIAAVFWLVLGAAR
jgi:hypothetical protein